MTDTGDSRSRSGGRGTWRPRPAILIVGLSVVAAGLLIHYTWLGATADFLADALYAILVYLLVMFVVPQLRPITIAAIAYGICVLVEFAQLTDGPTAVAAVFPPAVLVLGNTFAWVDLMAYAVGIASATACVLLSRGMLVRASKPTTY